MAEFPHPEHRNLWRGSMLSKDRSALAANSWNGGVVQTDEGLEITISNPAASGAASVAYTNTAYRMPVTTGKAYSLLVPAKNTGALPCPIKITSYLEHAGGSMSATTGVVTINPGETKMLKIENQVAPAGAVDIRWSWRVDAGDPRPTDGAKITLMDGIALIESPTVPAFPFNGDRVYPVETVLRRNLVSNPSFESGLAGLIATSRATLSQVSGVSGVVSGSSALGITVSGASASNGAAIFEGIPIDTMTPGRWMAIGLSVTAKDGPTHILPWLETRLGANSSSQTPVGAGDYIELSSAPVRATRSIQISSDAIDNARYVARCHGPGGYVPPDDGTTYVDAVAVATASTKSAAEAAVATYFDGDSPASGSVSYRWAPDGTSLEVETIQPPTDRTVIWEGEPYKSESALWVGDSAYATGVFDISAATEARLGLVADVYSRSREKIVLELAGVDEQPIGGQRVELAAAAMTASNAVWHWRQITGPEVELEPRGNCLDFIAPDVDEPTEMRIAVYAASEDGRNRSDWKYFDLEILPSMVRFRADEGDPFAPATPLYVGYDRGKREIWNDVIAPNGFAGRKEPEILDLGIPVEDVEFTVEPPEACVAGGIYVNPVTGDVFRNFGAGYNETDDTTAAPRRRTYWVNPATGDISQWIEDEHVG